MTANDLRKMGGGEQRTFTAHGRTFVVSRLHGATWHLRDTAIQSRSRFGSVLEIAEDVAAVLEGGGLPGGDKGRW